MLFFDLLYRNKLLKGIPSGDIELIFYDTTGGDVSWSWCWNPRAKGLFFKEKDENIEFTIVEGTNFEIVIVENFSREFDIQLEINWENQHSEKSIFIKKLQSISLWMWK